MAESVPFLTLSSRRPPDGNSTSSSRDSAYGSSAGDERIPSATHDISRVNYHIRHLPDFARSLEDSAARAFPNHGSSQRYKKVRALLLHWKSDDLFVLPELEDLETCFREDYNFETELFSIPSDNAHLELMLKIGAMIKDCESSDTLFIIYYGGHARIDHSRQSTWCANRNSDSPWLQWSAIQTLLERSLSDVLILLDCCAGAASATFPNGNSITETISASSWDAIAPEPGRFSFSSALLEVLQEWNKRAFSAAMLHAEILARLKHPWPEKRNGTGLKRFEERSTPVHFMMTANHRAPSIEMSRIVPNDARPPSPPQELTFEEPPAEGRSAGPQGIIGSEPTEDVPHVMISLALEEDQRLNISDWEHWLQSIPAIAKYVKVQGVFKSHSTLLLLSMPVMVWDLLPDDLACNFVAFVRSNNLMMKDNAEPVPVEEEVPVGQDTDAESRFSIFSGTTAFTFDGRRPSVRSSMGLSARSMAGQSLRAPSIHLREPRPQDHPTRRWPGSDLGVLVRQQTAPPKLLNRSMSYDNFSKVPVMNQQRDSRRNYMTSRDHLPSRPPLAPHVQSRLEEYFLDNPGPTVAVKEFLASNLGIETTDIDLWFFHRREQQEVADRLQSLRIDSHGHDRPREVPWMILPGHLNKLLEVVPPSQVLTVDLRSPGDYEKSHIHGAINFRAPASFVTRATPDLIEKALPNEASRGVFSAWPDCRCIVFYDKHIEFAWEAPTAGSLYQKLKANGWEGHCFVLKGHYREFSASFDKYIVGTKMTDTARSYLLSLQEKSYEKTVGAYRKDMSMAYTNFTKKQDYQQYDEWFKQLEGEDTHHTDLVPAVKAERMEAMVRNQKHVEDEFESQQPSLYRKTMDLEPPNPREEKWDIMGPMVAPLSRGIAKIHDVGTAMEPSAGDNPKMGTYQSHRGGGYSQEKSATSPGIDDYDLLESDEEQFANERVLQKVNTDSRERLPLDDISAEKKQARGRGLFNKIIRSGRPDASR